MLVAVRPACRRISSSRSRSRSRACSAIVVLSYRQTVRVYETSGGAYVVARENLGTAPSLVAAAALLTDYVLTVAVSISAGIFAITSFAPSLSHTRVGLSLVCLVAHRAREPARRPGVGAAVRAADLCLHHLDPRCSSASGSSSTRPAPAPRGRAAPAAGRRGDAGRCSSSCARSRPARPRSPASRRSRTASTRSATRRERTPPGRSAFSAPSRSRCSSASRSSRCTSRAPSATASVVSQVARAVRVNGIAPATVVAGSTMFPRDRVMQSLQKYKIDFSESETTEELRGKLADFYAQRTLTKLPILPQDCAAAVVWLASDQSGKTTGHVIPVDGGLSEAFLR